MKSSIKLLIITLFCIFTNALSAQEDTVDYRKLLPVEGLKYKKTIISFAANTDVEFIKPVSLNFGFECGGYIRLFSKAKQIQKKSIYDIKIADRDLFIKPTFGFLYRERYHTGIYFMPSLVYRHTTPKLFYTEISVDGGYYYAKLNMPVYEVLSSGEVQKTRGGFSQCIVGGKFLAGLDFSKNSRTPLNLFGGVGLYYTYPNNQNWSRHVVVQVGMAFIIRRNIE
jgi:hypothetical protein